MQQNQNKDKLLNELWKALKKYENKVTGLECITCVSSLLIFTIKQLAPDNKTAREMLTEIIGNGLPDNN